MVGEKVAGRTQRDGQIGKTPPRPQRHWGWQAESATGTQPQQTSWPSMPTSDLASLRYTFSAQRYLGNQKSLDRAVHHIPLPLRNTEVLSCRNRSQTVR